MPITYKIDPDLRLVEVRFTGPITVADLQAYATSVFEHPLFGLDLRILGDITGMEANFSSAELVQYQTWRQQKPPLRMMAIVASTDYEFGIARMFTLATNAVGKLEMCVFKNREEAREWLGVAQPKTKSVE